MIIIMKICIVSTLPKQNKMPENKHGLKVEMR